MYLNCDKYSGPNKVGRGHVGVIWQCLGGGGGVGVGSVSECVRGATVYNGLQWKLVCVISI